MNAEIYLRSKCQEGLEDVDAAVRAVVEVTILQTTIEHFLPKLTKKLEEDGYSQKVIQKILTDTKSNTKESLLP